MNGNKKVRRDLNSQILSQINEMINLFGNKSKVADEIDPSIFKGLYNPIQQSRSLDPITGMPFDELTGAPTEASDWWKKEQGLVKDPDTREWYKPDFPLGSAGGQPTSNPEFHQGMEKELARLDASHQKRMRELNRRQRRQVNALLREKVRNTKGFKVDMPLEDDSLRIGNLRGNILGFGAPTGFAPSKETIQRLLSPGERLMPKKMKEKYRALWKDERAVLPSQRNRPGVQYV
jgi:hypothetical protein